MTIGDKIKKIRTFRHMTQAELGAALGWGDKGANRLAQYETNYRVPRKDLVTEMAKILDVNPLALHEPTTMDASELIEILFWIDYGLKDNQNMGACMAPAACDTIAQNLVDFNREPADYDRIVTGDLGVVGREILLELLKKKGYDISEQHSDCGMLIFDPAKQDTGAGGSGCGCAASVLAEYLLPKLENGEWKRILFVPTGALMSKVSFQEGSSVPGIAQAVVIEREEDV